MIFSSLFGKSDADTSPRDIGHDELQKALSEGGVTVVDVREPHEFAAGHIPGAINLPLSGFKPNPGKSQSRTPVGLVGIAQRLGNSGLCRGNNRHRRDGRSQMRGGERQRLRIGNDHGSVNALPIPFVTTSGAKVAVLNPVSRIGGCSS